MNDREIPKILVVDDVPIICELIKEMLENSCKCSIVTASNGIEGLEYFKADHFDLVLTDIFMPQMNGLELLRVIRGINKSIPIIVCTGFASREHCIDALRLGANCFLIKPQDVNFIPYVVFDLLYHKFPFLIQEFSEILIQVFLQEKMHVRKNLIVSHNSNVFPDIIEDEISTFINYETEQSKSRNNESRPSEFDRIKQFCHSIVHSLKGEFMNLGNAIRSLHHDDSLSSDSRDEINVLEESIQYCQLLTRRLIDFVDLGKASERDVHVVDILEKAKSLLAPRMPSTISFEISIPSDLPDSTVHTDPEEILMVLVELVENAKRALSGREGSIQVHMECFEDGSVQLSVRDDGPGIPTDVQKDLFKKQVASQSGTGFGLLLSNNVISSLGGEMLLQSSSETGTTITIHLPSNELLQERQT